MCAVADTQGDDGFPTQYWARLRILHFPYHPCFTLHGGSEKAPACVGLLAKFASPTPGSLWSRSDEIHRGAFGGIQKPHQGSTRGAALSQYITTWHPSACRNHPGTIPLVRALARVKLKLQSPRAAGLAPDMGGHPYIVIEQGTCESRFNIHDTCDVHHLVAEYNNQHPHNALATLRSSHTAD